MHKEGSEDGERERDPVKEIGGTLLGKCAPYFFNIPSLLSLCSLWIL